MTASLIAIFFLKVIGKIVNSNNLQLKIQKNEIRIETSFMDKPPVLLTEV